jgi:hypothetical protein
VHAVVVHAVQRGHDEVHKAHKLRHHLFFFSIFPLSFFLMFFLLNFFSSRGMLQRVALIVVLLMLQHVALDPLGVASPLGRHALHRLQQLLLRYTLRAAL